MKKFRVPTAQLTQMADFNGPCEIDGVERALTKEPRATGHRVCVYQPLAALWMQTWNGRGEEVEIEPRGQTSLPVAISEVRGLKVLEIWKNSRFFNK